MARRFPILLTGLTALFVFSNGWAQPRSFVYENWGTPWFGQSECGTFGPVDDPCTPQEIVVQNRFPGADGSEFLDYASLWIGGIIIEGGNEIKRVSVALDGWVNPEVVEFWPANSGTIQERSNLDTVDCFQNPIFNSQSLAHHEFIATFCDTFCDPSYVHDDPIDGSHRPLGVKVTRTTYTMMTPPCDQICWIRCDIENIGSNFLKDLYIGHLVHPSVGPGMAPSSDDEVGFDREHKTAYWFDNDGRRADDTSAYFPAPHVIGMRYLNSHEILHGFEVWHAISFNWWVSNSDSSIDYGPAWRDYHDYPQYNMLWSTTYGTPMGDFRKYQIMSNWEQDFSQYFLDWVWGLGPQNLELPYRGEDTTRDWWTVGLPDNYAEIAHGYDTKFLYSMGPVGILDYQDMSGRWIYRLNPGEHFTVWMAMFGGYNIHNPLHPQPPDSALDPFRFDFSDLFEQADRAIERQCVPWLKTAEISPGIPDQFALDPIFPNPFNSQATIRFHVDRAAEVQVTVYDVLGRAVQQLVGERMSVGTHEYSWNASGLPTGLYFIEARTNHGARIVQKALLMK
ncbi:MAG: T9SS type A sorting domain-containing protein [Calditrichota bacterium]